MVVGHRRCVHCGYGLRGQPILRDEHYGLFLARCPECGRPSALDHVPVLARAARLWSLPAALLWAVVVIGILFASAGTLYGLVRATAEVGCEDYRRQLDQWYRADAPDTVLPVPPVLRSAVRGTTIDVATVDGTTVDLTKIQTLIRPTGPVRVFNDWWSKQDPDALLASAGGRWAATSWVFLWIWLPLTVAGVTFGCFWAVVMTRASVRRRLATSVVLILPVVCFLGWPLAEWSQDAYRWAGNAAASQLGPPILVTSVLVAWASLVIGLLAGRRIARVILPRTLPFHRRRGLVLALLGEGIHHRGSEDTEAG
jgi:hypothetical protein